jgi:hypothetical protein
VETVFAEAFILVIKKLLGIGFIFCEEPLAIGG